MENPAQPETFSQLIACSPYVKSTGQLPTRLLEHIYGSALTEPEKLKTLGALVVINHCGVLPRSVKLSKPAADKVDSYLERMEKMRGTSATQKKNHANKVGDFPEENGTILGENSSVSQAVPAETTYPTPDSLSTENQNQNQTQTQSDSVPTNTNHPTREEVRSFGFGEGLALDPDSFFDSMEGRGWKDRGGNPVNSWKGLYRSWAKRIGEPAPPKARKPEETASALTMELPDGTYLLNGQHMRKNERGVLESMEEPWEGEDTSGLWIGPDDIPSFPWEGEELPSFPWDDEDIPF